MYLTYRWTSTGRLPAIYDPNTDLTLWESGAIIQYLVDRYDQEHKLSFPSGSNEAWSASQWLFFQVSGQGPYFGQVIYFRRFHHENVPSTVERFIKEVHRVTGVLEGHLKKQKAAGGSDGPWLVGGKLSYADIAFIPWQSGAAKFLEGSGEFDSKEYPLVTEWVEKMTSRKAIKTVLEMADH